MREGASAGAFEMSEQLAEIEARIGSVRTLASVIRAMRAIAGARVRQTQGQLASVDLHAATVSRALDRVLSLAPEPPKPEGPPLTVLFLAEQGFAGSFNARLLSALGTPPGGLVVIGTRGAALATEQGLSALAQFPLPSHGPAIPPFADRLAETLLQLAGRAPIDAFHAQTEDGSWKACRRRIFPRPAQPSAPPSQPPLLTLPPEQLCAALFAEMLHAELCRVALHATAAENTARMLAMASAQGTTERKLDALEQTARISRQEAVTTEILELSAGVTSS
ncbi:hypothetical protein B6V76_07645 [Thioclava sp. IC9]|nr:hypothetical protein B6V76_07645 [Thioclava sp. IC9]